MIRSIEIEGLRGIREGRLDDLTPLVVLVGPNNSGKSTVLDALLIGASSGVSDAIITAVTRRNGLMQKARWLMYQNQEIRHCFVKAQTDKEQERTVYMSRLSPQNEGQVQISGSISVNNDISDQRNSERVMLNPVTFADDGGVSYSPTSAFVEEFNEAYLVDPEMVSGLMPLHTLYTRALQQGRRKEARKLVADLVPGVEDILLGTEGNRPILYLEFENGSIPVALAGEGVQSLLRTVLELASRPNGVVLLEEPEVHQHPGAIRQTARAIWAAIRRGIQVIISTHSIELIDMLLVEVQNQEELDKMSVYRLMLKDGCLRSSRTDSSDIAFARTTIGDDLR